MTSCSWLLTGELGAWVADPKSFIEHRKDTWLLYSDQILFWVKIGFLKIVFAAFELKETASRKNKKQSKAASGSSHRASQVVGTDGDAQDVDTASTEMQGQTQKRGADPAGDKCRLTFEARQAVSGYFDSSDPVGHILPSVLVVEGAYARVANITDDHKFIRDDVFWVGDEKIEHKAGQSSRGLMKSYVDLRKAKPELFDGLVLLQQPAAYMDEITTVWTIEDGASRVPQAVHQRDLFSAALGDTAKKTMQLSQTLPSWIASKMTPCLQLTDTDIAFPLKRAAAAETSKLARERRTAALKVGENANFSCGPEAHSENCTSSSQSYCCHQSHRPDSLERFAQKWHAELEARSGSWQDDRSFPPELVCRDACWQPQAEGELAR